MFTSIVFAYGLRETRITTSIKSTKRFHLNKTAFSNLYEKDKFHILVIGHTTEVHLSY